MGLRNVEVSESYDTGDSNIDVVRDFFEPCLDQSVKYDRLSGYFSSRVLALAARGLGGFLAGEGRMRLITSANIAAADLEAMLDMESESDIKTAFDARFREALNDRFQLETILEKSHLEAMCWLLKNNRLEIRIVVPNHSNSASNSLFHSKVGIFTDGDNQNISFSGSVNETVYGWTQNIEEFKVFKSWEDSTSNFVRHDIRLFEKYWSPAEGAGFVSMPLSDATKRELISIAPPDAPDLISFTRRRKPQAKEVSLRDYQIEAVQSWVAAGYRGIFAMATGTGKTKTAAACIKHVRALGSSLTLVTAPYQHIAMQWMSELSDLQPILATGDSNWWDEVKEAISKKKLSRVDHILIIAVQNTAASEKFRNVCQAASATTDNFLIVGDEAHGLGASTFQGALNMDANFRLALSATPVRYFDEIGTDTLKDYFGDTCFEFDTAKALTWIDPISGMTPLCPYEYHPLFVGLSDFESNQYQEISEKIRKLSVSEDEASKATLERLLFKRAGILKTASQKLPELARILDEMGSEVSDCLIYCNDFEQLTKVAALLAERRITFQKITGDEGSSADRRWGDKSEREWILENFAKGQSQVLLAIKCLDEGVDIPSAKLGFILASSGNPREFIQRRGRLMRRYPGKSKATIFDFVVSPGEGTTNTASSQDLSIFRKELARIDEFAKDALNRAEVHIKVTRKLGESL